jgi:hypothetical protein
MLSQTYDAFLAAGAPEEKARAAAEEIAAYETRLAAMANDIATIIGDVTALKSEVGEIRRTMATKAWVLAQTFVLLGGVAALVQVALVREAHPGASAIVATTDP